ncbi:kin of IRRE-like protein 3 isoform X7 [Branchiostoma floridae x Branchiostoma belcheri]
MAGRAFMQLSAVLAFLASFLVLLVDIEAAVTVSVGPAQTVLKENTVVLQCTYSVTPAAQVDIITWSFTSSTESREVVTMLANTQSVFGTYENRASITEQASLRIENVGENDEGTYRCTVKVLSQGSADTKSVDLTVLVAASAPTIVSTVNSAARAGDDLTLTCRSDGGKPLPTLTWFNGTQPMDAGVGEPTTNEAARQVIRDLSLSPVTRFDDQANFVCKADQGYPDQLDVQTAEQVLDVQYPPVASISSNPNSSVKETNTLTLTCVVQSNPDPSQIRWLKVSGDSADVLQTGLTTTYVIPKIIRSQNGTYRCEASNGVIPRDRESDGQATVNIDVYYAPKISSSFVQPFEVNFGSSLPAVTCEAEGNPTPNLQWVQVGSGRTFNNPLSFATMTYAEDGTFTCVAAALDFPKDTVNVTVNVIGRPDIIGDSPAAREFMEGKTAQIVCEIQAKPRPSRVEWFLLDSSDNRAIITTGGPYRILQENLPKGMKSILQINSMKPEHSGRYVCKATNTYGEDEQYFDVTLQAEDVVTTARGLYTDNGSDTTLVIIIVVVVLLLLLLLVGIGLMLAHKRGLLPCKGEPETGKGGRYVSYRDENVTNEFSIEMADKDKSPTAPLPSRVESSQYIPTPLVAASYEARLSGASFGEPRSPVGQDKPDGKKVNSPAFPEPTTEEPPVQMSNCRPLSQQKPVVIRLHFPDKPPSSAVKIRIHLQDGVLVAGEAPDPDEKSLLLTSDSDSESDTDLESSPIVDYRESRWV